jgi:hypothetical protein
MTGFSEHGNEPRGFIGGGNLSSKFQILKLYTFLITYLVALFPVIACNILQSVHCSRYPSAISYNRILGYRRNVQTRLICLRLQKLLMRDSGL